VSARSTNPCAPPGYAASAGMSDGETKAKLELTRSADGQLTTFSSITTGAASEELPDTGVPRDHILTSWWPPAGFTSTSEFGSFSLASRTLFLLGRLAHAFGR